MMLDLGPFSDEKFDPKQWINAACQNKRPQDEESVEKYLVDLEMKLQMASEEIAALLEEQSSSAILRVPRVSRDVVRLRDDALSLRSSISSILLTLTKAEGLSAESIAALAKVDTVKQRMEAAYETLQDAAGLTQLSATVEDVFASGDLPRAADTLANMKQCLSAVGEVAEFSNVKKQLEMLEDRLDSMVQPRLSEAISNRKIDASQNLRGILTRIGRIKSLVTNYTKVHMKAIKTLWESFESESTTTSLLSWLPTFYDELLLYLEQEWEWCKNAFPEDYTSLVPKVLIETMSSIGNNFVSRINICVGEAVPESKTRLLDVISGELQKGAKIESKHLETLIELHNTTAVFSRNISALFSDSGGVILSDTSKAIYLPYEPFKQRYAQMERVILTSEISGIDLRGAVARGVGGQGVELSETVRRMEESIPQVIVLLEASFHRSISFGINSDIVRTLDDAVVHYISLLQEPLKSLRTDLKRTDNNEEEWSIIQSAVQVLTVSDMLASRFAVFEAAVAAEGGETKYHALAGAARRVEAFAEGVGEVVQEVLVSKVRGRLGDVTGMAVWGEGEEGGSLPVFNAYPQGYVSSVGEYLLTLPQQLELMGEVVASEVMFKVAEAAARVYVDQVAGIQWVGERGARQLAVDLDYFRNVLAALSVPVPLTLMTLHRCMAVPREDLPGFLRSDAATHLHAPTVNLVCKMRKILLD